MNDPRRPAASSRQLLALLIPIGKRMPAYVKLGWLVAREPAIPWIHRAGLYATVVYVLTPAHLAMNAVPIIGQMDVVLLLLLGIRQALIHCPPAILAKLCARCKIKREQLDQDLHTLSYLARCGADAIGRRTNAKYPRIASAGKKVVFAGRVAKGFTRRVAGRMKGS
jgi:uncharacterized membrane protein YkvA (DUF1232 family)